MTILSWGSAGTALAGQTSSGDRGLVVPFPGGALAAVIDGLGHGSEACEAALAAEKILLAAPYAPIDDLVRRCHEALRQTRGVVLSLASFDGEHDTMSWLGVGNVEALLVRGDADRKTEAVAMRGGTVGYLLPPLHPRTLQVRAGDTLVLATDGIRHGFKAEVLSARAPQTIADEILRHWATSNDDAMVIVARYEGMTQTRRIGIDGEEDVAHARIGARELATRMGFAPVAIEALATAVTELARNIVVHADAGEIVLDQTSQGVCITARDLGPGIADVERALDDGYTTSGSMGCGLSAARRLVDRLEVASTPGIGTVITIEKWLS
jgi:phosphoserine phosphatase RsbX